MLPQILIIVKIYAHEPFINSVMKIGCPSNRSQLGGEIGEIITSTLIGKSDEAGENGVDTLNIQDGNSRSQGSTVVLSDSSLPGTPQKEYYRSNAIKGYSKSKSRHKLPVKDIRQAQGFDAILESARGTLIPLHHSITGTSKVSKTVSHKKISDDNAKRKFLQQQNKPDEIHENEDENGRESVEITASKDGDQKPTKKQRLHSGLEKGVASSGRLTEYKFDGAADRLAREQTIDQQKWLIEQHKWLIGQQQQLIAQKEQELIALKSRDVIPTAKDSQ
ncbi:hypothetical protein T440DRAFT_484363 [Plenodomus tracheiphilus IPT5]|uniref:Uncharacterized protein n=1 Tax=Plenodomus tracheiphilus IPT5 TaxID=1408161 RepID=A0A6A7AM32_9PLEO|nr:hypothetical protein T440DRAFT_484363 [Plenodomus tracheiphilus IPT5]